MITCPDCGVEMKELFVYDPCSPAAGSFHYVDGDDPVGAQGHAIDVIWCPECGQIRGYLYRVRSRND